MSSVQSVQLVPCERSFGHHLFVSQPRQRMHFSLTSSSNSYMNTICGELKMNIYYALSAAFCLLSIEHISGYYSYRVVVNSLCRSVCYSVCLSVCRSVWKEYCGKTTNWIRMTFGIVSGVDRGMGALDWADNRRNGKGHFMGKFWASHCNQRGRQRALPQSL